MKPFHVYILRCADGSYYTGQTDHLESRLQQHEAGEIGYTATRKPLELAWQGEFETREGAIAFEQQIKGWSRAKKEALMAGDWVRIKELAKSKPPVRPELFKAKNPVRPELVEGSAEEPEKAKNPVHPELAKSINPVRPELVEGLRQAQPERGEMERERNLLDRLMGDNASAQRRAIAKAITLLESTRADHRAQADELLTALLPHTGSSFRLGISGVPGVGKSTFIEVLGLYLIAQGHRVAVLTIDPSSTVSGGSILGDKTRMEKLSVHERAYIRPSPSSGTLGGVAEKTREAMLVCEAAGYDVVIVETVGVGQSETAVADMTDMFVLMQLPNAGDDLQAIKKGVMELADLVVINKADIDVDAATRAQAQITSALRLLGMYGRDAVRPELATETVRAELVTETVRAELVEAPASPSTSSGRTEVSASSARTGAQWHPQVMQLSALLGQGVEAFWNAVTEFKTLQTANGKLATRRQQQALAWMWERIDAGLKQAFREKKAVRELLGTLSAEVSSGNVPASVAARRLLECNSNAESGWE